MESLAVNRRFWQGRRVLLTGHTGFKGTWLGLWLKQLGAETAGFALAPPSRPSLFEAANAEHCFAKSTIGNVVDPAQLGLAMRDFAPEIVIHMAAQALVRRSYLDPVGTYATNVMGTVNLLEAARTCAGSVRAILVVTSDKCYENREWPWGYRENESLGGADPYSSSKACAELVTAAYRRSFFDGIAGVATARAGNVIGGGDWAQDRLIADIAASFASGKPVSIRNPDAIRPWQHVLDALHGYLTLAQALVENGVACAGSWNFGPGEADVRSVSWVADAAARIWGDDVRWTHAAAPQAHEAAILKLDSARARTTLGWKPELALETALEWTIEWYKAYYREPANAARACLGQIECFEKRMQHD